MPSTDAETALPASPARRSARRAPGGIRDLGEAALRHLVQRDLLDRPETVLHRAQNPAPARAVPFEGQHRVDEVLERFRPRERAVLCDMADQDDRHVLFLREPLKDQRGRPNLSDGARRRGNGLRDDGLHRIDDHEGWRKRFRLPAGELGVGLREDEEVGHERVEPPRAESHLPRRFLSGDEQHLSARFREPFRSLQEQCRLSDARLSADEHDRARHEPAAEHTVEVGKPGRQARRVLFGDLADGDGAARGDGRAAFRGGALLAVGVPRAAFGTAAEPLRGGRAALGAGKGRPLHLTGSELRRSLMSSSLHRTPAPKKTESAFFFRFRKSSQPAVA